MCHLAVVTLSLYIAAQVVNIAQVGLLSMVLFEDRYANRWLDLILNCTLVELKMVGPRPNA